MCQIRIELVNIRIAETRQQQKREKRKANCSNPNTIEVPQNMDIPGRTKVADSSNNSGENSGMKRVGDRPSKIAGRMGTTEVLQCEWCEKAFSEKVF